MTESGICDASGNGGFDTANADAWITRVILIISVRRCMERAVIKRESAPYLSTSLR